MTTWGQGSKKENKETATKLRDRGVFPCLDVLYPGKFRAHCSKCIADCSASQFTRKNAVFIVVYHPKREREILVRILYDHAESLVRSMALGKVREGDPIFLKDGIIHKGTLAPLEGDDTQVQDTKVTRADIAKAFVDDKFVLLNDSVGEVFLLGSERAIPYLLLYHSGATPSKYDVEAYDHEYAEKYVLDLDKQFEESLTARK